MIFLRSIRRLDVVVGMLWLGLWMPMQLGAQTFGTKTYYPKEAVAFEKEHAMEYHHGKATWGRTTQLIAVQSQWGKFYFVFYKKVRLTKSDDATWSDRDLYARILWVSPKNEILEQVKFQDFGNIVYFPQFDYANCLILDENKDGIPEFYLSYMGMSDGLDAKPYKQIIYTFTPNNRVFIKSKATAYFPAGNEGDEYHEVFDEAWKALPLAIRQKSSALMRNYKKRFELKYPQELE